MSPLVPHGPGPTGLAWGVKRVMDILVASAGIVILSPLLLLIALAIIVESGWSPFFTQIRVGKHGQLFRVYKFRTMVIGAEKMGAGLYFEENDSRITRVGYFLRRYSLDELPQLVNVLMGQESLVGPRAMVTLISEKLTPEQELRHRVRPGITGWAQVNGRNALTWSARIKLDNWYIDNWTLWLDVRILLRTIPAAFSSAGVLLNQSAQDVDDLAK